MLLVATVGLSQLMLGANLALPDVDTDAAQIRFPAAIGRSWDDIVGLTPTGPQVQILIAVPAVALALAYWLNRTTFGKAVTASADNPSLSRLAGISPRTVSTIVWTVGGFLATFSMILLSSGGPSTGVSNLGITTLNLALVAAVLGGMRSFTRAMVGGVVIGILTNILQWYYSREVGLNSFIFFVAVLIAIYWQRRPGSNESSAFTPKVRPIPAHLREIWWIRNMAKLTVGALLLIAFVLTWYHERLLYVDFRRRASSSTRRSSSSPSSRVGHCHHRMVGPVVARSDGVRRYRRPVGRPPPHGFSMDVGFGSTRLLKFELVGVTQGWAIIVAAFVTAGIAVLTGLTALRVRGLMLAVVTFAFANAALGYLYNRPFFNGGLRTPSVERGTFFGVDMFDQRNFFYFTAGSALIVLLILNHLRGSAIGRRIYAVRDNPDTAAAYTVSPTRTKLLAFGLAGWVAGLAGGLFANLLPAVRYGDAHFLIGESLEVVGIAVIGGLGSITGAILGALWVIGLPAFFPNNELVPQFTSSVGLLIMLMYFPGGFIQIANSARNGIVSFAERRMGLEAAPASSTVAPASISRRSRTSHCPTSPSRSRTSRSRSVATWRSPA